MSKRNKGLLAVSVMFTLSFGAALAGCGGGGHNPTLVERKDPTCTEAGYEQYYLCSHCDKLYSDEEAKNEISAPVAIAALGHDMTKHDEDEATCTHPGNVEYYTCSREPGVYYADEAGSQTLTEIGVTVDHDFSGETNGVPNTRPAVDPTKDEYGRKPSWTCNSCHTMYGDAYGDKTVTEEDLKIDKIQETIDGELTEAFYHNENAFVIGASNVRDGGLGMVLNATFAKDGVYFHLVTNHNTPAAEQSKWGNVKIYINARNTEDKHLPGNAAVSEAQTICMNLGLNGNISTHDAHTVKSHQTVTNEDGAPTKFTTVWEVYCSFEQLAETNKSVLAYAFEKQDGKTVLKNGYNILVTTVGCMYNTGGAEEKDGAEMFEDNGTSLCSPIGDGDVEKAWYLWEKRGYSDRNELHKYMILTQEGFSENFSNVATEYKVKSVADDNVTISGLSEKVAANGSLEGTVTVKEGYVFRGLNINGKTVQANAGAFSVSLADLNLPWNTADITVTPVVIKNETQSVTLTLKDKAKEGLTPLANTNVSLTDGFGEPIARTTDASGVVTFNDLLCTTYTLTVEGYPQKTVVVTKGTDTAESELIKIFAIASNDNVIVSDLEKTVSIVEALNPDKTYTGTAEVVTDSTLKSANILLETTVRADNFADGWDYKQTMQRFMIQMTESGKGFFFWVFSSGGDKANVKAINSLTNRETEGGAELDINDWGELGRGWIVPLIKSEDGLKLRVVRNGGSLALYAYNGTEWVYFGSVKCEANDQTKIVLYGTGCGWEFSEMNATDLGTHVNEQLFEAGTPGNVEHFVNGSKYYLADGTPTTAKDIVLDFEVSSATVTLVLKDLEGNNLTIAGTEITIDSRYHKGVLTAGANGVLSGTLCAGVEYTVSLYGYNDATFTVEASGTATLTMNATLGYASNDNVIVNDKNQTITIVEAMPDDKSYAGSAEVVVDSALKNANVLFETTVKADNFADGWDYKQTMQRFMIQMTESGKGFFFWVFSSGGDKANIQEISSFTNREENKGKDLNGLTEKERGWIVPLIKSADGLKLRIVRNGDTIALFAYNGTDWVGIGNMKCEANDNLKVVLYGTGCGWEFSEMSVSAADNTEYVLNATVTGTKAGVTTNLDEGATVRFTNLLGYDKTFTVGANGTIGDVNEKLPAGEYTVTVSGNSYAVFHKKIYISADVTTLAFDYEKFTVVVNSGSYDRYDFSHVEGDNSTIAVNDAVERFNVLSTDTYGNVSVTLGGKFNNSTAGNRSQGIFIKFEDGKYMFLRFSWWDNRYKIEYMQEGGDTWELPVVQDWKWDDIHLFDETQTNKWTSNEEMELQLVRSGNTLKVYLEGVCVRTNELNEEYADDKVQVGFFAWDAAEDASWNFEISEELPEA